MWFKQKKHITIILLFVVSNSLNGQSTDWNEFEKIKKITSKNPVELSLLITNSFEKKEDQIKAIYYWITHNVEYDMKLYAKYKKQEKKAKRKKYTQEEIERIQKKEIQKTLKTRKGVCRQYSLLFKELCENSEIQCRYISGRAKTDSRRPRSFGEKHAWNVVNINDEWEVIDVTWGSGFVDKQNEFHFSFNPAYFKPEKEDFIMNHYPKEEKWQLLDSLITKAEFKNYPIIGSGFIVNEINNLSPSINTVQIEKVEGFKVTFETNVEFEIFSCNKLIRKNREDCVEKVDIEFWYEGNITTIKMNTNNLKSGNYVFYGSNQKLFSYRVEIK